MVPYISKTYRAKVVHIHRDSKLLSSHHVCSEVSSASKWHAFPLARLWRLLGCIHWACHQMNHTGIHHICHDQATS